MPRHRIALALVFVFALDAVAAANGRPPMTNGVVFRPGDTNAVYAAATFGLLASTDGCQFFWFCEDDIGYGGPFDPNYAVTASGAILATTFHGLRVSRDGGCSFQTATAELAEADPGRLPASYLTALAVGPAGEVWVGTSSTGSTNGLYRSTDEARTFSPRGHLPESMWIRSIAIASGDGARMYVAALQISSGGGTQASGHWFRSDDGGDTWQELGLAGVAFGSEPELRIAAVVPGERDIVYLASLHGNAAGDRLYRSIDGGLSLTDAVDTQEPITAVVARDATTVIVATRTQGIFESTDRGATFVPVAGAPQLACLAQREDGVLFGCAANYEPDHMALARSTDARTWDRVASFEYLSGPAACPAGTAEHNTCAPLWQGLISQLGVEPAMCARGPDRVIDGPPTVDSPPARSSGCCQAGAGLGSSSVLAAVMVGLAARRGRRARGPARASALLLLSLLLLLI